MTEKFPKAESADICLLLEGTFPFVLGGVSSWVYQLIEAFPNYRFAAIFLGGRAEDYSGLRYPLPKNLVHLDVHYLFSQEPLPEPQDISCEQSVIGHMETLHDQFRSQQLKNTDFEKIAKHLEEYLISENKIDEKKFLYSKESWDYILHGYKKYCPENSFIDYFWSVRNMHRPIWELVKIARHVPKVKLFHSISTGYAGFLGALLHYHYKHPFILTEHGIYTKERWIDLLQKWWTERTFHGDKQTQEDSEYLVKLWIGFFENLGHMCYASANPIISLFEAYRERQIHDGAEANRTRVIPNAVNIKKYNWPHKKEPDATHPIVCLIGRVVPIKDIKTFIRAMGILATKIPTIQGWIVGSEEENPEYVAECKNLVTIMGLTKCIEFTGEKSLDTIFPEIDLVLLSSISEGLPFVVLEAFAAGIPVVTTDVGACSELIYGNTPEDRALGAAGITVSIADPEALATAALQLLQHPKQWVAAQKVGLQRVNLFYNMKKFIEQYTDVYKGALG